MAIADKLALLADTKEQLRQTLGLPVSMPFAEYYRHAYLYDPTALFAENQQGVLYEPWDLSTLCQDAVGTQPVASNGDPVGLRLDKSQGLKLGGELIAGNPAKGTLSTYAVQALTTQSGVTTASHTSGIGGFAYQLSSSLLTGDFAIVTFYADNVAGKIEARITNSGSGAGSSGSAVGSATAIKNGLNKIIFNIAGATGGYLQIQISGAGSINLSDVSVKKLYGNHAVQTVSAARPTYQTDSSASWLYYDKVDDAMTVKLPSMTATVVTVTDDGVAIDYPVAIVAGDYALTNNSTLGRDYGRLIIDRELSVTEQEQVTKYFNAKRGA